MGFSTHGVRDSWGRDRAQEWVHVEPSKEPHQTIKYSVPQTFLHAAPGPAERSEVLYIFQGTVSLLVAQEEANRFVSIDAPRSASVIFGYSDQPESSREGGRDG